MDSLVEVADLSVSFPASEFRLFALKSVDLSVRRGEILCVVGESGSGKSTLARAMLGLLPKGSLVSGTIQTPHGEILSAGSEWIRSYRAHDASLITQDPASSLNPVRRVIHQLLESCRAAGLARALWRKVIREKLRIVDLEISQVQNLYPYQLSGGMSQRVVIAMALIKDAALIVADEPTSALDVRTQSAIARLLSDIASRESKSILMVTHDVALALAIADRVCVLYGGRVVEIRKSAGVARDARHPYSQGLIRSTPSIRSWGTPIDSIPGTLANTALRGIGCPYAERCPVVHSICRERFPTRLHLGDGSVWCWDELERV